MSTFRCKRTERGRPPFVGVKDGWLHLRQFEQMEHFVLGSDRLPSRQRGDDAPYFLLGQMGVPIAAQLAAEDLRVQAKLVSQVLLEIANCTQVLAQAVAKCSSTYEFHLVFLLEGIASLCQV